MSKLIYCPACGHSETKVIDVRSVESVGAARLRECSGCEERFTTLEERFEFQHNWFHNFRSGDVPRKMVDAAPIAIALDREARRHKSEGKKLDILFRRLGISRSAADSLRRGITKTLPRTKAERLAQELDIIPYPQEWS